LPHGTTVWTSHKAFDEGLTTGYNLALLEKLGANVKESKAKVLVGYKGDEGRRIGIVAGFGEGLEIEVVKGRIGKEFGDLEGEGEWFGFDGVPREVNGDEGATTNNEISDSGKINSIACMNAFHPAEVDRVATAAVEAGLATSLDDCSGLLYLTGAANEEGVEAALKKSMKVVCVGHRLCEVWGIGYLAERVRERWPSVEVQVVDEEEVKPPKEKKEVKPKSSKKFGKAPKEMQRQRQQKDVSEAEIPVVKKKRMSIEDNEDGGGVLL
jgi:putative NIF3 family GTP cyclohydrolase 1 type 2